MQLFVNKKLFLAVLCIVGCFSTDSIAMRFKASQFMKLVGAGAMIYAVYCSFCKSDETNQESKKKLDDAVNKQSPAPAGSAQKLKDALLPTEKPIKDIKAEDSVNNAVACQKLSPIDAVIESRPLVFIGKPTDNPLFAKRVEKHRALLRNPIQ